MIADDLTTYTRKALADKRGVREIKMFGGIGFMINGNLLVGASSRGLLVRVGKDLQNEALKKPNTSLMIMRGRPMHGYIRVTGGTFNSRTVEGWVKMALDFVITLPAKTPKPKACARVKTARKPKQKTTTRK